MDSTYTNLGSGLGWLLAFMVCQVFHRLRRSAPTGAATFGIIVAGLWLFVGAMVLLFVVSDPAEREYGDVGATALKPALIFLMPPFLCAVIAWLHRRFYSLSALVEFGILALEVAVTAVLFFVLCGIFSGFYIYFAPGGIEQIYQSARVALPLSLLVEEIAGPLRRGTETIA